MRLAALSVLFAFPAFALAQVDVKGVPFGASEAVIIKTVPGSRCGTPPRSFGGDRWCHVIEGGTYAGAPAQIFFILYNDAMQSATIFFASADYQEIAGALAVRHGKPTSTEQERLTTRMGAVFTNTIMRWTIDDVRITARRYGGSVDKGSVTLQTSAARAESEDRERKAAPERAKDL